MPNTRVHGRPRSSARSRRACCGRPSARCSRRSWCSPRGSRSCTRASRSSSPRCSGPTSAGSSCSPARSFRSISRTQLPAHRPAGAAALERRAASSSRSKSMYLVGAHAHGRRQALDHQRARGRAWPAAASRSRRSPQRWRRAGLLIVTEDDEFVPGRDIGRIGRAARFSTSRATSAAAISRARPERARVDRLSASSRRRLARRAARRERCAI